MNTLKNFQFYGLFGHTNVKKGEYKGFSNRDITILSMNKTQEYLRY